MDINNTNNQFLQEPYNYQRVVKVNKQLFLGQVVSANRNNHLFLTYDVKLFDYANSIISCKLATQGSNHNGIGKIIPLAKDTPVLVLCKEGELLSGFIIGSFNTFGDFEDLYEKGKIQETNQTDKYNQPINLPNRYTQPDSVIEAYSDRTINNTTYIEDSAKEIKSQTGIIKLHNTSGDYVIYTPGQNIQYSEGNIIQVSGGTIKDKKTKLSNFGQVHLKKTENFKKLKPSIKKINYEQEEFQSLIDSEVLNENEDNYLNLNQGIINAEFLYNEDYKIAMAYLELVQENNSLDYAVEDEVCRVEKEVNSKINNKNNNVNKNKFEPKINTFNNLTENKILESNIEDLSTDQIKNLIQNEINNNNYSLKDIIGNTSGDIAEDLFTQTLGKNINENLNKELGNYIENYVDNKITNKVNSLVDINTNLNFIEQIYEKVSKEKSNLVYKYIVFHNAGENYDKVLADLQNSRNDKSYHILIKNDSLIEFINFDKRAKALNNLKYNNEQNLDKISYNIGFITTNQRIDLISYQTAAYQVSNLIKKYKLNKTNLEFITHQEIQKYNNVEIKDMLNFNLQIFNKYLNGFN